MIRINLVPREILDKERQKLRSMQALTAVGALLIVVMIVSWVRWSQVGRLETHLHEREKRLETLKQIVNEVRQLEAMAGAVRTRLGVITDLLKGRPLYPYFMGDISKTLPAGIWFTNLQTTFKQAGQLSLSISALANSSEALSDWLRNIEKSGRFAEPTLSGVSISETNVHTFTLQLQYTNPEL